MKRTAATVMALAAVMLVTACANGGDGGATGKDGEVRKLTYACPGKSARYNFVNEDGELDGYEIALMKEVDKRLEDVTIDLVYTGEFSALFPGLESGQYDYVGFR